MKSCKFSSELMPRWSVVFGVYFFEPLSSGPDDFVGRGAGNVEAKKKVWFLVWSGSGSLWETDQGGGASADLAVRWSAVVL